MANKVKDQEELIEEQEGQEQGGLTSWLEDNTRLLLLAGAVVVLIIGAVVGYDYLQGSKGTEANGEMFFAVKYFEQDSLNLALNGDGTYMGFLDVIDAYGGTEAGNMAKYYTGIIYIRQGNLDEGVDYLKDVSKGDDMLSMASYMALGFAHEDLQDPSAAANYFEKAASTPDENPQTTPTMLLQAGVNYEEAGDNAKALKLYRRIKDDYPSSTEAVSIDRYIGRVSQ